MKTCTKCDEEKLGGEFCLSLKSKDGLNNQCKVCDADYRQLDHVQARNRETVECPKCKQQIMKKSWHGHKKSHLPKKCGICKDMIEKHNEKHDESHES
jgi:hypothetical protein